MCHIEIYYKAFVKKDVSQYSQATLYSIKMNYDGNGINSCGLVHYLEAASSQVRTLYSVRRKSACRNLLLLSGTAGLGSQEQAFQ